MKTQTSQRAFTLIELLVVISIIAILAGIALPVFGQVQEKGAQTKSLSNGKQIGLACKIYATDNGGVFPSKTLDANLKQKADDVADSNTALAQLLPDYMQSEDIFITAKSAFTPPPNPDNKIDNPQTATPVDTLKAGENDWALVLNLSDSSNGAFPLLATGFADASAHTYVVDQTVKGGVWKGKKAVVIRADVSGEVIKTKANGATYTVPGGAGNAKEMFDNSDPANWLGAGNKVVNPK